MNRQARETRKALDHATDYRAWREAAAQLDRLEGLTDWIEDPASGDYDWSLIDSRLRQLRQYRGAGQVAKLVYYLRQGLHWNLGNIGNPDLYLHCRVGTKRLIEDYVGEVCEALEWLLQADAETLPLPEKLKFFRDVALSYGRSALMLSGGATLGLFHVGVVRALYREGLLPVVFSGSSAGSMVAAKIGTHRPEDLELLLEPENAYYEFWKALPTVQVLRRGVLMDQSQLRTAISRNIKDLTFDEAYRLSGRSINITVSPAGVNQPPRLLNHLTFPHLYLREAVLASSAVPLLFPPVMLMTRDENGERQPYMPQLRWNDGSLRSDLPTLRLRRLHNVNHFIVSQTNPHVLPFMSRRGPGAGGLRFAARDYAYSTLKSQSKALIDVARALLPLPRLRRPLDMASSILSQDYRGNINIFPRFRPSSYIVLARNPSMETVRRFILEGERAAWSRMEMVRMQTSISQMLERCLERVEHLESGVDSPEPLRHPRLRVVRQRPGG